MIVAKSITLAKEDFNKNQRTLKIKSLISPAWRNKQNKRSLYKTERNVSSLEFTRLQRPRIKGIINFRSCASKGISRNICDACCRSRILFCHTSYYTYLLGLASPHLLVTRMTLVLEFLSSISLFLCLSLLLLEPWIFLEPSQFHPS